MAMGQQQDRQGDLMVSWSEMPRSPGHVFYDRLQSVLIEGGFDSFVEATCKAYYAAKLGAPSVPPGRYFRMHLVGYFEGISSECRATTKLSVVLPHEEMFPRRWLSPHLGCCRAPTGPGLQQWCFPWARPSAWGAFRRGAKPSASAAPRRKAPHSR